MMACTSRDMRLPLLPIPMPSSTQELEELLARALYQSAAITREDMCADPVHYWLGMWGKVSILMSVKLQGFHRKLDPEVYPYGVDWDLVFRHVHYVTPKKQKRYLTVATCRTWFKRRIDVYNKIFPAYRLHCESAIDNLTRHYAEQLMIIKEMGVVDYKLFYWENLRKMSQLAQRDQEPFSLLLFNCDSASAGTLHPQSLIASSFCCFSKVPSSSLKSYSTGSGAEVSPNCTNGEQKIVSEELTEEPGILKDIGDTEVEVGAAEPIAFSIATDAEGKQNVCLKIYTPQLGSSNVGHYHPVFEHNGSVDSSNNESPVADSSSQKRRSEAVENHPKRLKTIHENLPDQKTDIDSTARLLGLFDYFKSGRKLMVNISWILEQTAAFNGYPPEVWPCEFFMDNIERKIKSKEIVDFPTMLNACRCLIALYLLGKRPKILPEGVLKLQKSLKTAAEFFERSVV